MEKRTDIVVLRTGFAYEADMVANALEEAGLPFYRRQESSSGLEFAMPVAGSSGPGIFWIVRVPLSAEEEAKEIIKSLPVSQDLNPGVWDFGAAPRTKSIWRVVSLIMVVGFLISVGWQLVQAVAAWFGYLI